MTTSDPADDRENVAKDDALANSRATGGVANSEDPNNQSTTSTSDTPDFVGRVAGDDVGYAGETGAEARTEADRD